MSNHLPSDADSAASSPRSTWNDDSSPRGWVLWRDGWVPASIFHVGGYYGRRRSVRRDGGDPGGGGDAGDRSDRFGREEGVGVVMGFCKASGLFEVFKAVPIEELTGSKKMLQISPNEGFYCCQEDEEQGFRGDDTQTFRDVPLT
ncbi:hypothetical protein QJS10_CPB11g01054 [Acorus calamus]|uniref:Uncharacterized protein n=1 Tax=Acorus calamus TaxID=4465 RepID=A0AAV9DVW8_ACOCL|nr:hypothetical protein QJS10_CPB11g01054 [Acorus calamus]